MEYTEELRCPKCNSNLLSSNTKGFSLTKALGGAFLTGGIGLLAGFIGSKKIRISCLKCGNQFNAGEGAIVHIPNSSKTYENNEVNKVPTKQISPPQKEYTEEELEKKFKAWEKLVEKGLITKEELENKKNEFNY